MRKSHRVVLAGWAGLCVSLALPAVAGAKGPSTEETVAAAKASALHRRELRRDQLQTVGLGELTLSPGVKLDVAGFVKATALDVRPELAPLLDPKLPAGLLSGPPVYRETIHELEDRLLVERKLTVALAPGACSKPGKPQAVADLCFTRDPAGKPSKEVDQELAGMRAKLAKAAADKIVLGATTVAQARAMSDEQLLDLLLNSSPRTIHQVSVIPRFGGKPGAAGVDALRQFGGKLGGKLGGVGLDTGLVPARPGAARPKVDVGPIFGGQKTFERDYFLTGFTYGREFEDSWEVTFADATWLTDRYFVRVDYHLGLGFGLRAPFAIDVHASGTGDRRDVSLAVAPVDVDSAGSPAYQAVGLPASKTFDGKEFVLEFKASCGVYVSIPGPNIDKKCPTLDLDYSRDVDPVIGGESSSIGDWWLDGKVTGLALQVPGASATLDVGLGADVTKGVIGMRASALPGTSFVNWNAGDLAFTSRDPLQFAVTRAAGAASPGFRVDSPSYGFDVRVTPKLRGKIEVDVAVYEKTWILGPWALGALSISSSFQLGHHAGTVASHDYAVFAGNGNEGVLDPSAGSTPPPKKHPKAKGEALPLPGKAAK